MNDISLETVSGTASIAAWHVGKSAVLTINGFQHHIDNEHIDLLINGIEQRQSVSTYGDKVYSVKFAFLDGGAATVERSRYRATLTADAVRTVYEVLKSIQHREKVPEDCTLGYWIRLGVVNNR